MEAKLTVSIVSTCRTDVLCSIAPCANGKYLPGLVWTGMMGAPLPAFLYLFCIHTPDVFPFPSNSSDKTCYCLNWKAR